MLKRHLVFTTVGCAMLAAGAIAQTTAPSPTAPAPAGSPSTTAPSVSPAPMGGDASTTAQNLAAPGKWRASRLMGVDVYGPDNKKVGDVTEVVFDRGGMIETVTVGVGGFLGLGTKDVAIPFNQITWMDTPPASGTAPASPGASGTATSTSAPASVAAQRGSMMYPDHGMISMTREQLSAAPAVNFSSN